MHAIPQLRIALAFVDASDELACCLARACRAEPGAQMEVVCSPDGSLPAGEVHAVVCPEDAPQRRPETFRRLSIDAARRGVPVLVEGAELESVPRRLRLSLLLAPSPRAAPRPDPQRALPLDEIAGRSIVRLPPHGPTVTLEKVPLGVRLVARDDAGGRRTLRVRLGVRGLDVRVDGHEPLTRGPHVAFLDLRRTTVDAFSTFADELAGPEGMPRDLLEPLVQRARLWLARAISPHARALARRFHPELRWLVAFHVTRDASGRLAQLATALPGLFAFASGLYDVRVSLRARRAIVEGAPQKRVLDVLLDAWVEANGHPSTRTRQAAFVRRAGPWVVPEHLSLPVADGILLDDVPRDPRDNARWFRTIAGFSAIDFGRSSIVASLAPFVSAQGASLGELDGIELQQLFLRLATRGEQLRRWPSRKTSVDSARHAVRLWPEEEIRLQSPAVRLPAPTDRALRLRRLETTAELAAEGEEMHHCVATFTSDVLRGRVQIFSAHHTSERLTLAIEMYANGLVALTELRGFANAEPSRAARASVERWIRECRRRAQ